MTTAVDRTIDLLAPPLPPVDDRSRTGVRDRLVAALAPLMEELPPGDQVVVNPALLRRARADPRQLVVDEEPFAWKPAFARRSLGLAVVSACASGRFRTPADAVGPVAAEAVDQWKRTGWRTFHWEPWLAGLPTGARVAVLADALTWATALWSSFDWRALPAPVQIGGVDDQWICPGRRGRCVSRPEPSCGSRWPAGVAVGRGGVRRARRWCPSRAAARATGGRRSPGLPRPGGRTAFPDSAGPLPRPGSGPMPDSTRAWRSTARSCSGRWTGWSPPSPPSSGPAGAGRMTGRCRAKPGAEGVRGGSDTLPPARSPSGDMSPLEPVMTDRKRGSRT